MIKLLDLQVLNGLNYWSVRKPKLIVLKLDIQEYEDIPTNKIDGFYTGLKKIMPTLYDHYCSEGIPGGFFERVKKGTLLGHVVEHIALEIQKLAGMPCGFGRTRTTGEKGIYHVVFEYGEERAGIFAGEAAIRLVEALIRNEKYPVGKDISELLKIAADDSMGPSTSAIVHAARARDIPYIRLDKGSLVQLGYGCTQKRIEGTLTDLTSSIAVDLACDKEKTKDMLRSAAIPVPEGGRIKEAGELEAVISEIGYPLVTKPADGNQGKGVTLNIRNFQEALTGFERAKAHSEEVVVERFFCGKDYRILVVNYRFVAASLRIPAMVTGNGNLTVQQLIDQTNMDPSRGENHEKNLTKIKIDASTIDLLKTREMTLDSVPADGELIYLKQTANLSTGGTAVDVTGKVHPDTIAMAERAARVIGLDICGIDLIAEDIELSLEEGRGVIVEVNAAPGLRMHTHPSAGRPRKVGEAVVEMLFPSKTAGRIPIVAITGTNGKTTTARLLAYMAKTAGYHVGYTTTEGVYIGDDQVEKGDCTGPLSTQKVLQDRSVNFAVLECARGGMLRGGLAFDQCDVGIVTNVAEDHIGLKGIRTVEQMAKVKSIVAESVKKSGVAILNADNDYTYHMKDRVKCSVALFTTNPDSERLKQHLLADGLAAVYKDKVISLRKGPKILFMESVDNIPLAFGGRALFMIENIMAALLAGYVQNFPLKSISEALNSFSPSFENTPGRMNIFHFRNFTFILDYAHNSPGMDALGSFILLENADEKVGIITAVGDRRDTDIVNFGKSAAGIFDRIIIRIDEDTRGRNENDIICLLMQGIHGRRANMPVKIIRHELDAIHYAFRHATPGSLIVLLSEDIKKSVEIIRRFKDAEESSRLAHKLPNTKKAMQSVDGSLPALCK